MTAPQSEIAAAPCSEATRSDPDRKFRELAVTGLIWLVAVGVGALFWMYLNGGVHGLDSHAYWLAGRSDQLYSGAPATSDAYLYSPAFATLISPLTLLPWSGFMIAWMAAEAAVFAWLLKPLGLRWGVLAFSACVVEISVGNIYAFLALCAVVSINYPTAWALPLLTKITPGVGPIWYAVRREWQGLAVSVFGTLGIAAASLAMTPGAWHSWLLFLVDHRSDQWYLPVRFCLALAVVAYAAAKSRPWLLPVAMLIANPVMAHELMSITLLAAVPRLVRMRPYAYAVLCPRSKSAEQALRDGSVGVSHLAVDQRRR